MNESSVAFTIMVSKGFGMALGSLQSHQGQHAHNKKNLLGAPFGRGPLGFELRCPKLRYIIVNALTNIYGPNLSNCTLPEKQRHRTVI